MSNSPLVQKSYSLSVEVSRLVLKVQKLEKEYVLTKQLLRSATSVGANIEEAQGAHSRKDFIQKLSIAYKEALETRY